MEFETRRIDTGGEPQAFALRTSGPAQRGVLVALGLDQHIQNLALGVDGAPQVNHAPIDFQVDLVKMPDRMRFGTALSQFRCNVGPKRFTQRRTVS